MLVLILWEEKACINLRTVILSVLLMWIKTGTSLKFNNSIIYPTFFVGLIFNPTNCLAQYYLNTLKNEIKLSTIPKHIYNTDGRK